MPEGAVDELSLAFGKIKSAEMALVEAKEKGETLRTAHLFLALARIRAAEALIEEARKTADVPPEVNYLMVQAESSARSSAVALLGHLGVQRGA